MKNRGPILTKLDDYAHQAEESPAKFWLWWGCALIVIGAPMILISYIFG